MLTLAPVKPALLIEVLQRAGYQVIATNKYTVVLESNYHIVTVPPHVEVVPVEIMEAAIMEPAGIGYNRYFELKQSIESSGSAAKAQAF
jgi:hypothetical protein